MSEAWGGISLTGVGATGNLTQLYPNSCPAGIAPGSATNGQMIRRPFEGFLETGSVQGDSTNAGVIELWDINGLDVGADVSSAAAITNTQLTAAQALGLAKLLYTGRYAKDATQAPGGLMLPASTFQRGLAARNVASGTCLLNVTVGGGFGLVPKVG